MATDWNDWFDEDVEEYQYNLDYVLQMIRSSTFDATLQQQFELAAWAIESEDDYIELMSELHANQLQVIDIPGYRMDKRDVIRLLKQREI